MLLQNALNQALIMQKEANDNDQNNMLTKNHRTVHGDCLKLFGKTIFHLNRTLECFHGKHNCSSVDAQTWLNTSLTNFQTCIKAHVVVASWFWEFQDRARCGQCSSKEETEDEVCDTCEERGV